MQDWEPSLALPTVTCSVPRCQSHVPVPTPKGPLVTQSTGAKSQTGNCLTLSLGPRRLYLALVSSPDIKKMFLKTRRSGRHTWNKNSWQLQLSSCDFTVQWVPTPPLWPPQESSLTKRAFCAFCRIWERNFKFLGGNLSRVVALECPFHWGVWGREHGRGRGCPHSPSGNAGLEPLPQDNGLCGFTLARAAFLLVSPLLPVTFPSRPSPQSLVSSRSHNTHPLPPESPVGFYTVRPLPQGCQGRPCWRPGASEKKCPFSYKRGGEFMERKKSDFHEAWFPWKSFFSLGAKEEILDLSAI